MNITGLSMWYADAGKHLAERAQGLLSKVGVQKWIWSVRPSNDLTVAMLHAVAKDFGREVQIVEEPQDQHPERLPRLSAAGDRLLGMIDDDCECVLWHESDLLTYPTVAIDLCLGAPHDVVGGWPVLSHDVNHPALRMSTPYNIKLADPIFYDTWGYRAQGKRFINRAPYHEVFENLGDGLPDLDSVGSVVVIDVEYIHNGARMNNYGLVGLCESIRAMGGRVTCLRDVPVVQPAELWRFEND